MDTTNTLYFGYCRFCLSEGHHKDMIKEYSLKGEREIYADMFLECFNIFISTGMARRSLICAGCVSRLRAARAFRTLVVRAEQGMRDALELTDNLVPASIETRVNMEPEITTGLEIKMEPVIETDFEIKMEPVMGTDFEIKTEPVIKMECCEKLEITEHEIIQIDTSDIHTEPSADHTKVHVRKKLKHIVALYPNKSIVKAKGRSEHACSPVIITKSHPSRAVKQANRPRCSDCGHIFTDLVKLRTHQDIKHTPAQPAQLRSLSSE